MLFKNPRMDVRVDGGGWLVGRNIGCNYLISLYCAILFFNILWNIGGVETQ